jgi:isoaspartyl peptidase/L-asparaginase-like protein (Ntn-hydrolase superfamily)
MLEDELDPIDRAFAEGTPIDQAIEEAVREALKHHKRAGNPIVVWRNGEMHWVQPEDIRLPDEPE